MNTKTATVPGTTKAEADILAATAAALAAGGDPFGDEDDDAVVIAADDDADNEDGAEDQTLTAADDDQEGAEPLSAEALEAIADEPLPTAAQRYDAGDPSAFKTKRAELLATKATALKDLMDGVIEPQAYSAIEADVTDKLDALTVQRTLHEANVQNDQQSQSAVLTKIMVDAKAAGEVDYADPKAGAQFDLALKLLADDGEKRTYAQLAAAAHTAVLAIRGVTAKAAPVTAKPAARENGKGPLTLRNVPAAATPNAGGGWQEQMATLSGKAYEIAFSKLTPAQRESLLND